MAGRLQPPAFRFDIAVEVDLIEEIARVHGYDRIAPRQGGPGDEARRGTGYAGESRRPALSARPARLPGGHDLQLRGPGAGPPARRRPGGGTAGQSAVGRPCSHAPEPLAGPRPRARQQPRAPATPGAAVRSGRPVHSRSSWHDRGVRDCRCRRWHGASRAVGRARHGRRTSTTSRRTSKPSLRSVGAPGEFDWVADTHPALHPGRSARLRRRGQHVGWLGPLHPEPGQAVRTR